MNALAGRRVLVTRPRAQAATLIAALEAAGAVPVILPLIAIAPPDDPGPAEAALDRLDQYDWIVCTSANGGPGVRGALGREVPGVSARLQARGHRPQNGRRGARSRSAGPRPTEGVPWRRGAGGAG